MKNENMDNVITTDINESYGAIPSGTIAMPYQGSDIPLRDTNRSLMETKISHPVSSGGKGSFINTLVGRIAQLMRISLFPPNQQLGEEKRPLSLDEIINHTAPVFSELRKADGTRYKGNTLKAINGALSSTGIFVKLEVLPQKEGINRRTGDGS